MYWDWSDFQHLLNLLILQGYKNYHDLANCYKDWQWVITYFECKFDVFGTIFNIFSCWKNITTNLRKIQCHYRSLGFCLGWIFLIKQGWQQSDHDVCLKTWLKRNQTYVYIKKIYIFFGRKGNWNHPVHPSTWQVIHNRTDTDDSLMRTS